ncbi:MAG TPA: glycosyltransferase family 4 protein [Planctomycetaceae bacterium]|nr:glycosyltransferase family 4 protein [Planctomycetaceae bacterium]
MTSSVTEKLGEMGPCVDTGSRVKRVLVLTGSFPSRGQPVHGVFVKERVRFVAQLPDIDVQVVSPIPYFPPIRWFPRWYPWSQVPLREEVDGLQVHRRRYFMPPAWGGYVQARLMYRATCKAAQEVRQRFEFDLIDSHFIYSSGVVAVRLGKKHGVPAVITCRGEDIERFPDLPLIGRQIRWALREATQLIAVSRRIADRMVQLGADPDKVTVIPNGVDLDKFQPVPKEQARQQLGLPTDRPLVLAVGYRLELKGFHILVDAIASIRERFPDELAAIVGGEARWAKDFLPEIERRIRTNGVENHVILAGTRPQQELPKWYSAADVLCILSSREGSPNVLMEALACGLPAVATPVGGIPEVLKDRRLGILLPKRSAEAAAEGVTAALSRPWDRHQIRQAMQSRSWHETARQVREVFDRAMAQFRAKRPCQV